MTERPPGEKTEDLRRGVSDRTPSTIFEKQLSEPEARPLPTPFRARLLVVDDDEDSLRLARKILSPEYDVTLACDGEDGLRKATASPPDLILSDVSMPRMTGVEFLREIRLSPSLQNIPFVAVTGLYDQTLSLALLRDGAQDFLVKPFLPEELLVRVANLVRMKNARDLLQKELDSRSLDLLSLIAEVTERRAVLEVARAQAERASQAKSDFLTLVSHEFKTPLTVLRLLSDVWERRTSGPGVPNDIDRRRFAGAVARLEAMVDGLMEAARIQSGRFEIRAEETDLRELLGRLEAELEAEVESKGLSLRIEVSDEARFLNTDPRLIWLIISNLLVNAVKYTQTGEVEVRIYKLNGTVIEVRDFGRGISPEDIQRIFDSFVHLEPLGNKSVPGLGLGLALVSDLTAALGGRVAVRSQLGKGSVFTVTL